MTNLNRALMLLLTTLLFAGCSTDRIIDRPVPVEVVRTEYIPVSESLVTPIEPSVIPDKLTYGMALTLWAQDRRAIANLNKQLEEIRSLSNGERER